MTVKILQNTTKFRGNGPLQKNAPKRALKWASAINETGTGQ